jgi:hypothetical protein
MERAGKIQHISKPISKLAEIIQIPTNLDEGEENYILTEDEANAVIEHEVKRLEKFYQWKVGNIVSEKGVGQVIDVSQKIDVVKILEKANSNKIYAIWLDLKRQKDELEEQKRINEIKELWNAKMFLRLIRWTSENTYGKPLIEDEHTLPLIKAICFFLSEDERFETELGYSLQKGLWIRGVAGLGKTHIVRCAANNERNPIDIFSMLEITQDVKESGEYMLPAKPGNKIYIDDVGSEESVVNHYGTKIYWFKDFLERFYLRSDKYNKIIISTNYNFDTTEQKYGFRVRSRIKDMFNVIDVTGKDLRG